ncbi:MAG: hypothetical protein KJ574_02780 [Nanoarchaeota archaeon]|nr:hypothetical protein [Nanoarchaeota archaeon]
MGRPKPVKILLRDIRPTEYLIPRNKLDEIATHYDGTPESIKPVIVIGKPGEYYPQNGNKRALFLRMQGVEYVLGFVDDPTELESDFEDCKRLARQAEEHGVNTLDDLKERIVSRAEFERLMKKREAKRS